MPTPGGALVKCRIAAKALGLAPKTVRKWIRKKTIGGEKRGGRWYVYRVDLDRLVAAQLQVQT